MHFYLAPYETYVHPSEGDLAFRVSTFAGEPHVDLSRERTPQAPGWAFVATERLGPTDIAPDAPVVYLGDSLEARMDAATRQRVLAELGVRVLTPGDVLYAVLVDPTPAEGGRVKPRGVQRTPSGRYEVVIGDLTVTWAA